MKISNVKAILMIACLQLLSISAFAAIPKINYVLDNKDSNQCTFNYNVDYHRYTQVDYSRILPVESERGLKLADVAKWIPTDMQSTNDGGHVASHILGRSIQSFFTSPEMKNSSIGRSAQSVQQAMQTDVSLGSGEEGAIKHVFKFQLHAEKTQAMLKYTGLMNAQITYHLPDSELKFEVREKLAQNTDLVLSHMSDLKERRQTVSLSYNF